jgi:phospholipid/cholesterol/gamma-HCH transport system substrate-binding protein
MKFSIRFADQIVGTLVVLALAILVFVVFMIGKNQRWFVNDSSYKAYFASASGINPNMAVQYKGFTIGHVKKLSLSRDSVEGDRVEIIFSIFEEYADRVTEGSLVERMESPIGLGNSFNFYPGKGSKLPEGSEIPVVNSPKARELISKKLADEPRANDSIGNIVNQVNSILETINKSLVGENGEPVLGQIVSNVEGTTAGLNTLADDLSNQLKPLIANLELFTKKISDPTGAVMGILDGDGPLYESIDSLAGVIDNLNKTSEFIPAQLPQIAVAVNELNIVLKQIQDVLTSIANNPLLKNGIPEQNETGPTGANPRDQKF